MLLLAWRPPLKNLSAWKCCMRASMRAESSASPWRHHLVETKGHAGIAYITGGLHITVPDVETTVKLAIRA